MVAAMDEDGNDAIELAEWLVRPAGYSSAYTTAYDYHVVGMTLYNLPQENLALCAGLAAALSENVNAAGEVEEYTRQREATAAAEDAAVAEVQAALAEEAVVDDAAVAEEAVAEEAVAEEAVAEEAVAEEAVAEGVAVADDVAVAEGAPRPAIYMTGGPSGAGKDTLLLGARATLLEKNADGAVVFVQREITRAADKVRRAPRARAPTARS
jgi:hypothetical protein